MRQQSFSIFILSEKTLFQLTKLGIVGVRGAGGPRACEVHSSGAFENWRRCRAIGPHIYARDYIGRALNSACDALELQQIPYLITPNHNSLGSRKMRHMRPACRFCVLTQYKNAHSILLATHERFKECRSDIIRGRKISTMCADIYCNWTVGHSFIYFHLVIFR